MLTRIPSKRDALGAPLSNATLTWSRSFPGAVGHIAPYPSASAPESLLVMLRTGRVLRLSMDGNVECEAVLDEAADTGATCGALRPGEPPRIVATDVFGSVYCLSPEGKRLWKHARDSRSGAFRVPVAADVDGDGAGEILTSDSRGSLLVLDAHGKRMGEVVVGNYRIGAPAVVVAGTTDAAARLIAFGADTGDLCTINAGGEVLWTRRTPYRFGRSLPIVDEQSGLLLITGSFVSSEPCLLAVDLSTGTERWRVPSEAQGYQSCAIAEGTSSRGRFYLFGDKNTCLYAVDGTGRLLWKLRLDGHGIFYGPAILRDSRGNVLILQVVRSRDATHPSVYAVTAEGRVQDSLALPGGGGPSPLLCPLGDGSVCLITLSGAGVLERRDFPAPWCLGAVVWSGPPQPRVCHISNLPAASPVAPSRVTRRTARSGSNDLVLSPPADATHLALRVGHPDGSWTTRVHFLPYLRRVSPARGGNVRTCVWIDQVGRHKVDVSWAGGREPIPPSIRYEMTLKSDLPVDRRERERLRRQMGSLRPRLAGKETWLGALLRSVDAIWSPVGAPLDARRTDEARQYGAAVQALAQIVARLRPDGDVLVLPDPNQWRPLDLKSRSPRQKDANTLAVSMLGNEREVVGVVVVNLTERPLDVLIMTDGEERAGERSVGVDGVLEVRVPLAVRPWTTGRTVEDPLALLVPPRVVHLAPCEVRRLWLSVDSRHLTAGTHRFRLRFGDITSGTQPAEVNLHIRVSPVRLPERLRYRHCNWLNPAAFPAGPVRERVVQDALAHGTNVFIVSPPTAVLDASGRVSGWDSEAHDEVLRLLAGRAFLLVVGLPAIRRQDGSGVDARFTQSALSSVLQSYTGHMKERGFATSEYALYLKDEPGLCGPDRSFEEYVKLVRRVKAASPEMQVYANPAGGVTPEMLRPLAGLVDIWCPDLHLFRGDAEGFGPIFRSGREFWHYEASADQRNLDPLGFYRMQAWVAFQLGMHGAGYWVHSYDPYWFNQPASATEYGAVYMTEGVPVPSKRWEATRDGAEDYELLCLVRDMAASTPDHRLAAEAENVLSQAVAFVTEGQEHASDIGRQTEPILPDFAKWMDYRRKLIELAELLIAERRPGDA